eukprot:CAMPEP_0183721460 /NCGR_PEP_ID=MMETSP0737-20130205/13729_1 /TAXON_ID=385413 /ORGANISM="Thalassiosira miniscula, Strain CCMP1093" /LENGTH=1599 /DNA_ID=CAMNT_0025951471 /DNA_START=195 /DNA_END=4994 /DNA_ORIENTATION=+
MKDDSDSDEVPFDDASARTTSAMGTDLPFARDGVQPFANSSDVNGIRGLSNKNPGGDMKANNFAREDSVHNSAEFLERAADSLHELEDVDENDVHRIDNEQRSSYSNASEKDGESNRRPSVREISEEEANDPLQTCANTVAVVNDNTDTVRDGISAKAEKNIHLEEVGGSQMQVSADNPDNCADDNRRKIDTIDEDSIVKAPSPTNKIALTSHGHVQNLSENCTETKHPPDKCTGEEMESELNAEECKEDRLLLNPKSKEDTFPNTNEVGVKDDHLSESGKAQNGEPSEKESKTEGFKAGMSGQESGSNAKKQHTHKTSTLDGGMSLTLHTTNESTQSLRSQSSQRTVPKSKGAKFIPLKSSPPDRSLLTRGMSLFARSSKQVRPAKNDDANSVISEFSQDLRSEKSVSRSENNNDDALRKHLEESGLVLLKRLIEFLSECPPAVDEGKGNSSLAGRKNGNAVSKQKKRQRGLTLPASAIGWLSTQIDDSFDVAFGGLGDCYQVPKQQIQCLQMLLKRVTSLRISGEAWPPPHASTNNPTNPEKAGISSKILSKFAGDQLPDGDSLDDDSCASGPSISYDKDISVSPFQRYYHELQYRPNVNMSFFPNATKVVIDGIPPNWVTHLDLLQNLDMFQMEKGCILDVNQIFFPSDILNKNAAVDAKLHRDLSLIDEGKENLGSPTKPKDENHAVYPSLSKLRLSNCAMGEGAGLRGRAASKSVPRLPTFSRFPNLSSLNLSNNELFKTKTVFAGLSSLPLLSSINLSYNRLSSLDNIFMYIGNVTELILTGNEISSTRGLDRLFSLERLSLDENNIHTLTNIAGIAKIPFLMNLDLKGNPLESDDPASCRIKVFNLFREVRCNSLPKNATFRDMQGLLPVLDNELATKDELVALKDLTYRQTVVPDSVSRSVNINGGTSTDNNSIDDSSEISINMPDSGGGCIRRIVKNSSSRVAHMRVAGSSSLEKKAVERLERFHGNADSLSQRKGGGSQISSQFNITDLITTLRPEMNNGDAYVLLEGERNLGRGVLMAGSFSSHQSAIGDGNVTSNSPAKDFPFSLPSELLAEADDDVWTPCTHLDLIVPSDQIVWDIMPSDDIAEQNSFDEANDEHGVSSDELIEMPDGDLFCPDDEKENPSLGLEQESVEEDNHASDSGNTNEEASKKSMFNGIWEQSYRDNVTRNKKHVLDANNSDEEAVVEVLGFNDAEQKSQYDGPSDYGPLFVSSDLDLYFDSYIFHRDTSEGDMQEASPNRRITAPKIQLFKFDRDLLINARTKLHGANLPSSADFHERYIGIWRENLLACGGPAISRLPPLKIPKRGFHGETVTIGSKDVMASESRKFILCLSDSALYFIIDDEISPQNSIGGERKFPSRIPPNSTFGDAPWPHAVVRHSLECLSGITIGFQFQRLILRFNVGNSTTSSTLEYAYVILTSNKLRTVSFLQKLQSLVTDNRPGIGALIDNDDKIFLDALGAPRSNEVVMHYQILHQVWKRGEREASRRVFVLTDAKAYLLDETYAGDGSTPEVEKDNGKKLGDVSLSIIDFAILNRVTEVRAANEDPRKITLVILPKNKLKRSHRWRLVCNDGEGAERLIDDVRKAMRGHS